MFGDKGGSNGKFLKLDTEADIAVVGEEIVGNARYDQGSKRYVADKDGSFRFGVHVWDGFGVKVLEGGWRLYQALGKAVKADGADTVFHVLKSGSGTSTEFTASPRRKLTDPERAAIAESALADLSQELSWAKPPAPLPTTPGSDDVPF